MAFAFACATAGGLRDDNKIPIENFLSYALEKKVRYNLEHIKILVPNEIVDFETYVLMLILASCAGELTKLGVNNFRKLMQHLQIPGKEPSEKSKTASEFDSGRDSDDSN
jgi:hypothetical protein